ncbi:hypothetical protein ACLOJK_037810 [Asimina triloba]
MKTPISSDCLGQKLWVCACGNSIDTVERAHDTANVTFFDAHLKGLEKSLYHILLCHLQKSIDTKE